MREGAGLVTGDGGRISVKSRAACGRRFSAKQKMGDWVNVIQESCKRRMHKSPGMTI